MLYTPIFLLRRLIFIAIVFILKDFVGLQVMLLMLVNLLYLIYIVTVRPFKDNSTNKLEILNESSYFLVTSYAIP